MAFSFVRSLVKHTLKFGGNALGGGVVPIGTIASAVYQEWCASGEKSAKDQAPPAAEQARVRAELEKILQDARAYRAQVDQLLGELGANQPEAVRQAARTYLNQVPGRVQRSLRRPEDPSGRTVPAGLVVRRAEDLKQLLPERMPRFQPGAKPVPGTDLVVQELLGVGGFGEVWKAIHQSRPHLPPVALKFCIDETAARTLRKEVELLDRVRKQGRHRGIVELQYAHLEGNTPCLEYEYVDGGDLACLVTDIHRAGKATPLNMTKLFLALAQAVGFAHRIQPPVVHRDLKPTNVLTTRVEKRVVLKVLDFGIGGIAADQDKRLVAETVGQGPQTTSAGTCTPLYASPQQRRGAGPDPRDDVYALGVIWYQMLVGDVTKEPPRGGSWKKRLLDQGTTPNMLALLERCLEDDPADRPADAQLLAQELQAIVTEAAPPGPGPVPPGPEPVPPSPENKAKGLAEATVVPGPLAAATRTPRADKATPVAKERSRPAAKPWKKRWLVAGAGVAAVLLGIIGLWIGVSSSLQDRQPTTEKVTITGKYSVEGTNPKGGTYEGSAEITKQDRQPTTEKVTITGKYSVEGTNPEGGTYEGSAEITKAGDTYEVAWVIGTSEKYRGVGILQGNTLSVAYSSNGKATVVVYRIENGPKLVGQWAFLGGNGKVQKDTLTAK